MSNLTTPVRYHVLLVLALPALATWLLHTRGLLAAATLNTLLLWLIPIEVSTLVLVYLFTGRPQRFLHQWLWQDREPPYILLRRTLTYTLILAGITLAYPYVWQRYAPLPAPLYADWRLWCYYILIGSWGSALVHELVWRGYALDELKRLTGSAGLAILASGASYVLFYYPISPYWAVLLGVQGIFYSMAWLRTRHLGSIIIAHGVSNLVFWMAQHVR